MQSGVVIVASGFQESRCDDRTESAAADGDAFTLHAASMMLPNANTLPASIVETRRQGCFRWTEQFGDWQIRI